MTTPAPTQQMREKFGLWYTKKFHPLERGLMLATKVDGSFHLPATEEAWLLWQFAHQCGREEERAENVQTIVDVSNELWNSYTDTTYSPAEQAAASTLARRLIERIQGGK